MIFPTLTQLSNIEGKTVILRAGLNVPLGEDGEILDDFRLLRFLPTLHYLVEEGAKVIIIAHLGRDKEDTLDSVAEYLSKDIELVFKNRFFESRIEDKIVQLKVEVESSVNGSVFLLDNVRQCSQEKENDQSLGEQIAKLGDIYVNEAFSVSHREHMSLSAVPQAMENCVTGIACNEEIEQLGMALRPPSSSVAIIGGNKFATKLPLIRNFLKRYEMVIIGGALANTLYHLAGYNIGKSLYEDDLGDDTREQLMNVLDNKKLYLPAIVEVETQSGERMIKSIDEVSDSESIYDIAPDGLVEAESTIKTSDLVVWNGPMGYYEGGYTQGTKRVLEIVGDSSAQSIIGGGNTVDAARDLGYEDLVSHLSTGGGAMIKYLTDGTLPGLEVLR